MVYILFQHKRARSETRKGCMFKKRSVNSGFYFISDPQKWARPKTKKVILKTRCKQ